MKIDFKEVSNLNDWRAFFGAEPSAFGFEDLHAQKNPLFRSYALRAWIVRDGQRVVGRCAAVLAQKPPGGAQLGSAALRLTYARADSTEVAHLLWKAAAQWAESIGVTRITGPWSTSISVASVSPQDGCVSSLSDVWSQIETRGWQLQAHPVSFFRWTELPAVPPPVLALCVRLNARKQFKVSTYSLRDHPEKIEEWLPFVDRIQGAPVVSSGGLTDRVSAFSLLRCAPVSGIPHLTVLESKSDVVGAVLFFLDRRRKWGFFPGPARIHVAGWAVLPRYQGRALDVLLVEGLRAFASEAGVREWSAGGIAEQHRAIRAFLERFSPPVREERKVYEWTRSL